MEMLTVPLPVPFAPAVTVIHDGSLLTAVHGQIAFEAVTLILFVVAAAVIEVLVGDIVYEQVTPA